jgi:predicted CxxxxCH...CXXCH cytochrome family protein
MNNTIRTYYVVAGTLLAILLLSSCSELKSDLPSASNTGLNVHPSGWLTTASGEFHGKYVQANGFQISSCQKCHGSQYTGGTVGVSCVTCHYQSSPAENCTACHGTPSVNPAPPRNLKGDTLRSAAGVGAHQVHLLGGSKSLSLPCNACHVVPTTLLSTGHLDNSTGAEVRFDTQRLVGSGQSYTSATGTCANTYCHGNFPNGNATNTVVWTDVSGNGATCGTCHGDKNLSDPEDRARPKTISAGGTHPDKGAFGTTKCANCHGSVVDASLNIIDRSKHIDGRIN